MRFLLSLLLLAALPSALMAGEPSRFDIAKSDAYRLEGHLLSVGVGMNDVPQSVSACEAYAKPILWKGEQIPVLVGIDMAIERWGFGPNTPGAPESVIERAKRAAQDPSEKVEEAVIHPYRLQQWRIHRAIMLETCGSGLDGQATVEDLEAAYWLFRAAHLPPAYQRVANTLMERLFSADRNNDEIARWMCRRIHADRGADICDTMDITGGRGTKEAKR